VEGSLRTRKYTDKDGIEKYATDIRADSMQMLGGKAGSTGMDSNYDNQHSMPNAPAAPYQNAPAATQQHAATRQAPSFAAIEDDDIPF
jgi:single-strand DNA-binding protein